MSEAQVKYRRDYCAPVFTIDQIQLTIILDDANTRVTAVSHVVKQDLSATRLILDGEQLVLLSLKVDGKEHPYELIDGQLHLEIVQDECLLELITQLDPSANSSLEGLYMSDGAYCTQCEAEGFRRITYYLDRPDVLAKFDVRIEADAKAFPYLLSNGNLVGQGELPNGKHYVCWQDPFPKPCYLFALVAGDFDLLEDSFQTQSGKEVKLQVFVDKGNLHKAEHAMLSLKKSMAWDESRFNLEYDLDIYMIVAVDFFNMGAMENKGLNVFNTKYVLADKASATDDDYHGIESVVGHEYFHNWTGNRVTCRDWFQLSLKEGLTVFRDQEFSSDVGSRAVNRIHAIKVIKNQQFAEDSGPMAHPIRPDSVIEMNNFYTVTVYNKGAEVIRMMHTLLGEANFQAGMTCYFERHDGQAVTCDDFVAAMEDASGIDLTQFRLWYSQSGTPIVTVSDEFDSSNKQYRLTISQALPDIGECLFAPMHIPFDIELLDLHGDSLLSKVLNVTQERETFVFDNIDAKPIASLLQNFSAPVKLVYEYSVEHLVHLMRFASSDVARWESSVTLISQSIWSNVAKLAASQSMSLDIQVIDAFKGVLLDEELDAALVAEIFSVPSLSALIEQAEWVDLDALTIARDFVCDELAMACEDELVARYRSLLVDNTAAGRAMKNVCLFWICRVEDGYEQLAQQQYYHAENMTDALGALTAVNAAGLPCREVLMRDFEQQWLTTPLVMDKWFMLHATQDDDGVIQRLQALLEHSAFSLANPNRVRSLIGTFAAANTRQFHRKDGLGYQFLVQILMKLNTLNPQIAARIVTPLIQYAKFDETRQQQMKSQLQVLLSLPELSKDLYEKVSKALAQ